MKLTFLDVKRVVEKESEIPDLAMKTRLRYVAHSRFIYFALCSELVDTFTLSACGANVGRDHATVLHGLRKFNDWKDDVTWTHYHIFKRCKERLMAKKNILKIIKNQKCNTNQMQIVKS